MRNILKNTSTYMLMSLLFLLIHLPGNRVNPANASEKLQAYQPNFEYYLKKVEPSKGRGFIKDEIKKYRSFPHLERAYRLQRERQLHEARKEFEAYLVLAPDDIRTRVSYLLLLEKLALHNEVIAQADLILRRWPTFVPAYFFKGLAFQRLENADLAFAVFSSAAAVKDIKKADRIFALSMAADLALSGKNFDNAGRMLQALTEIEKKHDFFMKAGVVFEKSSHLKEAMKAFSESQKSATSPAEKVAASLALAEVAKKLHNMEQAKQAYEMVIENDNNNLSALRGLAFIAYQGGRYDEAEKWMTLVKPSGLNQDDREFLANLHLKRRNYAAAIQELKVLVEQQGKKVTVATLTILAQAYESAGMLRESAEIYKLLLVKTPKNGDMLLRYANLLIRMEKFDQAGTVLEKTLFLRLSDLQKTLVQRNLALVYEKAGSYEKAADAMEKSLGSQTKPGGGSLVRRALLLGRAGKSDDALQLLDRALADPALPDDLKRVAYKERSVILEKAGQTALAATELEKAYQPVSNADSETLIRLAVLLNKAGKPEEALRYLDLALSVTSLKNDQKRVALREKGLILEKTGNWNEAIQAYESVVSLGDSSPGIFLILANLYRFAENPETDGRYRSYLQKIVEHPDATTAEKCSAEDSFGIYSFNKGNIQEATDHLATALKLCGENWPRHYYLGLSHYRSQQWELALQQFLLADRQKKDPASILGIALCHKELGRPGAAVEYLLSALEKPSKPSPPQLKQIYDTLGHLYAEEYAYDKAADAFSRSLALAPDHMVLLNLANVYYLDNKTDEAWKALNAIAPDKLLSADISGYYDLKSGLLQKLGKNEDALALMEKTWKLQPKPSRSYALGILYQRTGQQQKAIDSFQDAYEKEPQQDDYALSLGYAYVAAGRFDDAIRIFELVAARTRESQKVLEELGYLHIKIGKNEKAVEWFKKTLDASPLMPQGASDETARLEKDAHRIRSEISKLTKTTSLALYAAYRTGKSPNSLLGSGQQISGELSGQLGFEASYRPPVIGFRNDRILELFGRVFGSLKPDTLNYKDDSTQAGIGLRYKFLQSENLWISGEQLIKIGKNAQDDWLFRLLYSRGKGFEPLPLVQNQDYYLVYGEIDEYVRSATVAASVEVRKGRAFTFLSNYMLTPHLVMDAHWQSPFNAGGNFLEGGAGISLKYFFNNTRYENYRSVIDFSINFKHGKFFDKGFRNYRGDYDSALFSLGFFY